MKAAEQHSEPRDDDSPEELLFEGHPALVPSLGAALIVLVTLGLALLYFQLKSQAVHYRITTQRVVIERGLLSKRMDQLDVYRIVDFSIEIPFSQRLLGTGNLVLKAMDSTTPEVQLLALKTDVRALYENLRRATEIERKRRGVRVVDGEAHMVP